MHFTSSGIEIQSNGVLVADTQRQNAASRRVLRAVQRRR